ncbi:MAG: hypothetical protein HYY57_06695 [Candidatus Omnitrophica bacterium]|nr:hypothetical protein [Candidatus Omnitrophota bacterium]
MRGVLKGVGVFAVAYLGWSSVATATVIPGSNERTPWIIESAEYTGKVTGPIVRMEAHYTIRVLHDGWVEIPLNLTGGTVTAVKAEPKSHETHLVPLADTYALVTRRKGSYRVQVEFSTLLIQEGQREGLQLGIPKSTFSTVSLTIPRAEVELSPNEQLYVESHSDGSRSGVVLTARLGAAERIAFRWGTKPAAPVQIDPVLYGQVHTLVTMEERLARITSIIEYRMAQGETKLLGIQVPEIFNILNVRGGDIEEWQVLQTSASRELKVTLRSPLREGTYRLVVEAEQPIEEKLAAYTVPALRLSDVKQERGFLMVAREGNIEISPQTIEGAYRVDVKELPSLLDLASGPQVILAFKYHQHPYQVVLSLNRHQDHPVLAAIAEQGELVTVLSRPGEMITRAIYVIKANKKQFLEAALPEKATLWSCLVNGESIKPVAGKNQALLIPLDRGGPITENLIVELVYFERRKAFEGIGELALAGPVLDVPVTIANWYVLAPHEVPFVKFHGNLEQGSAAVSFLQEPFQTMSRSVGAVALMRQELAEDRKMAKGSRQARGIIANQYVARASAFESFDGSDNELDEPNSSKPSKPEEASYASGSFKDVSDAIASRLQEQGILPLKIRLPRTGRVYRFHRLLTSGEAMVLGGTFIHTPMPWFPLAGVGLLILPFGALTVPRLRRRT